MRLATLRERTGATTAAVEDADGGWRRLDAADLSAFLAQTDWRPLAERAAAAGEALAADAELVLPLPTPAKVLCCGLNYGDHIEETGRERPEFPTIFAKFADTLTDPAGVLELPADARLDWEAELAVVIGREVRHATLEEAREAIAGYTIANDVSMRAWQQRTLQWLQGKAWDHTTPVGPVVVTADALDPAAGLDVVCEVNGEEVQRGDAATLVFDCADLVAYCSTFTVLRPGDLILTGTPGGVGMGMRPPRELHDGDTLTTRIDGIGELTHTIRITTTQEAS